MGLMVNSQSQGVDSEPSILSHKPRFIQALAKENNLTNDSSSVQQASAQPQLGRPLMETIRKFLSSQSFKGIFTVGLMDPRHVLLNFKLEANFVKVFSQSIRYVEGKPMRVFKWRPRFQVDHEPSTVQVYFRFPKLPIYLYRKDAMFEIAKLIGRLLRIDSATDLGKRLCVAQIQIEIYLLKSLPDTIWVALGHSQTTCHDKHPELKPVMEKHVGHPTEYYNPKQAETKVPHSNYEDTSQHRHIQNPTDKVETHPIYENVQDSTLLKQPQPKVRTNHVKEMVRTKEDENEKNDARNMRNGMSNYARKYQEDRDSSKDGRDLRSDKVVPDTSLPNTRVNENYGFQISNSVNEMASLDIGNGTNNICGGYGPLIDT
ncbi:hypothetical protein Tco_1021962 [Tanacetum coccineum]